MSWSISVHLVCRTSQHHCCANVPCWLFHDFHSLTGGKVQNAVVPSQFGMVHSVVGGQDLVVVGVCEVSCMQVVPAKIFLINYDQLVVCNCDQGDQTEGQVSFESVHGRTPLVDHNKMCWIPHDKELFISTDSYLQDGVSTGKYFLCLVKRCPICLVDGKVSIGLC